jgi:putative Holliday junction resolvase
MRVMAFDIGEVRTGIALSDSTGRIASPLSVLATAELVGGSRTLRTLLEEHEPELLLIGLPLSLDGTENAQAQRVRDLAAEMGRSVGLPLAFADERLSTSDAKRILREQGCTERTMRGRIDAVAASLFLQTWLDAGEGSRAQNDWNRIYG